MAALSFILGAALGSFVNVVALRYDPDKFLFSPSVIGGRSHCPKCKTTLRWFELIPFLSFALQLGRCRTCQTRIPWRYPAVELVAGLLALSAASFAPGATAVLWGAALLTLLLVSLIDLRLTLIPDEANVMLAAFGIIIAALSAPSFGAVTGSFLGPYAMMLGGRESIPLNRLIGFFVGAGLFGFLVAITRGRGMGLGDVKLAAALGILFGWPDIVLLVAIAFIVGAFVGGIGILLRRTTLGGALPFGPFLAFAAFVVFVAAEPLVSWYFGLFRLVP